MSRVLSYVRFLLFLVVLVIGTTGGSWLFVGTSTPSFQPTDISGLIAWYDASTVTKDGSDLVSSWTDLSGNGWHATQGTGSAQPTWVDAVKNGLPSLQFDGGDSLAIPDFGDRDTTFQIAAVVRSTSQAQYRTILGSDGTFADVTFSLAENANGVDALMFYQNGGGNMRIPTTSGTFANNTWYVVQAYSNSTTVSRIYINGTQESTGAISPAMGLSDSPFIGNASGFAAWIGDIAALVMYDSVLSDTDRASLETYFNSRYAVY